MLKEGTHFIGILDLAPTARVGNPFVGTPSRDVRVNRPDVLTRVDPLHTDEVGLDAVIERGEHAHLEVAARLRQDVASRDDPLDMFLLAQTGVELVSIERRINHLALDGRVEVEGLRDQLRVPRGKRQLQHFSYVALLFHFVFVERVLLTHPSPSKKASIGHAFAA